MSECRPSSVGSTVKRVLEGTTLDVELGEVSFYNYGLRKLVCNCISVNKICVSGKIGFALWNFMMWRQIEHTGHTICKVAYPSYGVPSEFF
jgi:hypothetical protein